MAKTTPPPRKNVLDVLPELIEHTRTTVRLHPRRGVITCVVSKIGGLFLWPEDEPWPTCVVDHSHGRASVCACKSEEPVPLIPVLQLFADDFPEMAFYPGTNVLQVFWCPHDHRDSAHVKPFLF